MALRCFLFSSDEGASDVIRQVLTGLGVEGESCSEPVTAGEKIANQPFHLVIIDWDQQPEANLLLTAARERKASERPLTLTIVSDDASVPKALQAGANSILRRPILLNQVRDTLTTARDLLRARFDSTASAAQAPASAGSTSTVPASMEPGSEKPLRAGEFLQSGPSIPGRQFDTEPEVANDPGQSMDDQVDPLKELETVAAAAPVAPPPPAEPRSLEELLRSRGVGRQIPQAPPAAPGGKPELLGYDQTRSHSSSHSGGEAATAAPARSDAHEEKKEAQLFAYISGEPGEPKSASPSRFRLGKGMLIAASVLAAGAIVLAPQAPWHPKVQVLWARGQRSLHAWLNPQPVTTAVAPTAHEDFGRAGDEYKLPVAENIPDATTDPSQIHVVPVVDPTVKKANNVAGADQPAVTDAPASTPGGAVQTPAVQVPDSQPPQIQLPQITPVSTTQTGTTPPVVMTPAVSPATALAPAPQVSTTPAIVYTPVNSTPPPKRQPAPYVPPTTKVPSSLQSQMATMTPDASGDKPPEAAMPSIEPVAVPELAERALLTDQPALDYPASAGAQQGTVVLQVLIGRDGAVQDAKFLQGALAFARTAIDGVKRWKFKPYTMNGHPVSVQTTLTVKFKPGA